MKVQHELDQYGAYFAPAPNSQPIQHGDSIDTFVRGAENLQKVKAHLFVHCGFTPTRLAEPPMWSPVMGG
jgi:hypothetical protein